ncbi:PRRC2C family protein [Megaselia abdita]
MSTLGGSKGERNAKPKFSALDINRLHKNSRGESVEPTAQKNQVPRKHGMQSLGKVPSTRRPPANLPSLKAEVRLPGTNTTNSNSNNSQTSGSIVNNNNNNTSSTLTSSKQDNLLNSSSSTQGTLLNHHHQHQNHSSSSANQTSSSSLQQTLTNSSSSSVTWSSVTTGHDIMGGGNNNAVPPHYQSPQFQHEFPSLDGSVSGNKGSSNQQQNREGNHHHHQQHHQQQQHHHHHSNHQQNFRDGNTGNGNEVSLRPQTDAASWHQRNQHQKEQQMQEQQLLQQTGGNNKFNANDTSINNQSGDGSGRIGGGQLAGQGHQQHHHNNPAAVVPPPLRALMPSFMMRGSGDSGGSGSRSLTPPTGQHQSNGSSNYQQRNYQQQNRSASPNFLRGQGGKRPSPLGRGGNSASSPYESEAVLQQRPIIKEEELERMNALAKSDGWALPDEIDYNKQLALSDDESPENTPTVERDRPPQFPKIKKDDKQNGHRPSTNVDQAALERAKLRKEEEERREQERRDGARKKLYELEMKMGASGPNVGATTPTNVEIDEDGGSDQSQNRRQTAGAGAGAGNRYDRERDFRPAQQANKTNFSSHFHANLPPRFQRQQAAIQAAAAAAAQTNQTSPPSGGSGAGTGGGRPPPTSTATQNTANYEREGRDPGKQVPFSQQYDPRYIHSQQNYKQQQQQPRRSGGYGRNRSDNSENDDEFSRYNRRSGGDSDHQGRGITRSISDSSSNRKISCSSNDEPQRSDSRDHLPSGSWADESDVHIGRRHRDESFSSSHSKNDDMEQGHVKILQRPSQSAQSGSQAQNKSLSESSTKNEKILEEEESDSKSFAPTQILRRAESPKPSNDHSHQDESNKTDIKDLETDKKDEKSPNSGSHSKEPLSDSKKSEGEDSSGQTLIRNDQKRPSPRSTAGPGNRNDIRGNYSNRGGYNSYGSSNRGGAWSRRGGGGGMRNDGRGGRHYNDWSESENSELGDDEYNGRRSDRSPKNPKKDHGSSRNMGSGHNKEVFVPRGEPSRRGRGGGGNLSVSSSAYRRGGSGGGSNTVPARRNDSYNSKSGFPSSSNDDGKDKSSDDVKKRDLEKKDDKKGTTPPKSSSSSSVNSSYQHTRKESTSSSKNEDQGKRDDKKDNIPQRSASSGQIKSSNGSSTTTTAAPLSSGSGSAKKDDRKPSITKPPPGYNTTKSTVSPQSQPQIAQKISNPNANQAKSPSNAAAAQQQVSQQWVSASDTSVASVTSTSTSQILDGSSAPVNTIIFENTNYKTSVSTLEGTKQDSSPAIDSTEALTASLTQMSLNAADVVAAAAEYEKEIKIGAFGCFDAEFPTRLTSSGNAVNDDKSSSLPRSSSNSSSVASSASDLNLKIASVKKVWDTTTLSPLMEQHNANEAAEQLQQQAQQMHHHQQMPQQLQHLASHIQHAYTTFEEAAANAGVVVSQDTGVDVVKQAVDVKKSSVQQQQQLHHPSNLGLSPPPSLQQQQQQQQLQHQVAPATQQFYPPSQYPTAAGIPTIPSPPVLFNSSGIAPSQSGMYPFIEPRSQFSQFPTHYGTTGTQPYNAYAMQTPQMQTAPPQAQNADYYTNIRSAYPYRMSGTVQSFNQNQQINNPNAVLISSSSNSLISASAKPPSNQQLGTIGSKNNVDAAAAIASVNYGQQYMNLYQQQGPPPHGGHHSQIPSNSYYSNSAGAYFSAAANSGAGTQSYGMFGGHAGSTGGSHSTNGPPQGPQQIPNFSSQFQGSTYNTLLAPAALNQFRGAGGQQQSQQAQGQQSNQQQQYIKAANQGQQNHLQDSMGRQLKSPLGADVTLNLGKPIQPQQSPPHHKNYSQSFPYQWDMNQVIQQQQSQQQQQQQRNVQQQNQMNSTGRSGGLGQGPQRYPAPIQRPTNYPQHPAQQNQQQRQIRHEGGNRSQGGNNGPPMNKHYYGNSGGNRGQHPSNQIVVDQHKNPSSQLDKDGNVAAITQQEMTVKEDNSND